MSGSTSNLVAVVLAAGLGTRLRPLTTLRPKALCPVGDRPLVDHAIARAEALGVPIAVNVHHGRDQMVRHLDGRVHLSIEEPHPFGTAGALVALREWIAGRDVLVVNADAWHPTDVCPFVDGWQRERARLMVVHDEGRPDFDGRWRYTGVCLLPWWLVQQMPVDAFGLFDTVFSQSPLELASSDSPFFDCGTPEDYHAANMAWSAGANVIGEGAVVEGSIERTVVWPGAHVDGDETLVDAVRADGLTVLVRPPIIRDDPTPAATIE